MILSEFGVVIAAFAVLGMIYPHVLYPLLLRIIASIASKPIAARGSYQPTIDVCISAYNEQSVIEQCITSIINAEYPTEKLRVLVGDDGSSDRTSDCVNSIIQRDPNHAIELFTFGRMGKNAVMNRLMERTAADVVIFTDADTVFNRTTLSAIVQPLSDSNVGAAVGCLVDTNNSVARDAGAQSEATYRIVDRSMNVLESSVASTVASNGALYAVQRELLNTLPNTRVADDWANLLEVIKKRRRVVVVPTATVQELRDVDFGGEVRRTVRTASSGMATVWHFKNLLLPTYGWVAFFLMSHKIMRWLSPMFLMLLLIGTVMTVENTFVFGWLFYSQFAFYSIALLGYAGAQFGQRIPIASTCLYFVAMNAAFLAAMWKFITGRRLDSWNPTHEAHS